MKATNLVSLIQAKESLPDESFKAYIAYQNIIIDEDEFVELEQLTRDLYSINGDPVIFENFFIGFVIPQISKEFDLLRFGKTHIINIELKRKYTDKVAHQLQRNKYYLDFLSDEVYNFTYVADTKTIYSLGDDGKLYTISLTEFVEFLENKKSIIVQNIEEKFNPSDYLVSPFNSTEAFVNGKYFLTNQQDNIKVDILKDVAKKGSSFNSICGKAGTGKTLVTYDIVKDLQDDKEKVIVIHCGNLNVGQYELNNDYSWEIVGIRDLHNIDFKSYKLVVIDETQRIKPFQLSYIISQIQEQKSNCIFSYDINQCLSILELKYRTDETIQELVPHKPFNLTEKIRTNSGIASFIRSLFDKTKPFKNIDRSNIELNYFSTYHNAKWFIQSIQNDGWEMINYTPDGKKKHPYQDFELNSVKNAHGVIGQEFDKVVAVIDTNFQYTHNLLSIKGYGTRAPFYHPVKMLFQIMTRTRRKLSVVVINNPQIMARCLEILGEEKKVLVEGVE